jgi:hypothetical protein
MTMLLLTSMACSFLQNAVGLSQDDAASLADLSGPALAKELADRVTNARSDKSREKLLLQVLDAVHLGVYTAEGQVVVRGAERGWGDFYLYDFEVQALGENLGRDQTYDLTTVAAILETAGLQINDKAPTAEDMLRALRLAILDSRQNPEDPFSLVPFLIQEIGLQQEDSPYDLGQEQPVEQVQLNGLQLFLTIADVLLPYVYAVEPIEGPIDLGGIRGRGRLSAPRPLQGNDCGRFSEDDASIPSWGKTLIRVANLGSKPIPKLKVAGEVLSSLAAAFVTIEAIHGVLLAVGIEVKEMEPQVGPTHYGHGSPGKQLQFRILVFNHMDIPERVRCGLLPTWLPTVEFPPKGPVSGVDVVWFTDGLEDHGKLDCVSGRVFSCYSTTGSDGIAKFTFTPKDETPPYGQGLEREEIGIVRGVAQYQTGHGNLQVGRIAESVTPMSGSIVWSVRYHNPFYRAYASGLGSQLSQKDICSLEEPFTISGSNPGLNSFVANFAPNSSTDGNVTFTDTSARVDWSFKGTYVVVFYDGGEGDIIMQGEVRGRFKDPPAETVNQSEFRIAIRQIPDMVCPGD